MHLGGEGSAIPRSTRISGVISSAGGGFEREFDCIVRLD